MFLQTIWSHLHSLTRTVTSSVTLSRLSPCTIVTDNKWEPVHIRPTLTWHNIYLYQPLRTYQRHSTSLPLMPPSTSAHIIHLSTCGLTLNPTSSTPALTASHPPFNTIIYIYFFKSSCSSHPIPPSLSLPPQSVYLCLKPSYPSLWLTHPPCYFTVPTACMERKRRYYPPIWHHSHLSVLSAGVSTSLCLAIRGTKIKTLGFNKLICFNNTVFTLKD